MPIALPKLPYALDALEPFMSRATLALHYGHHHKGYVEKLNEIIAGTPLEPLGLEAIIRETAGDSSRAAIFNNAAQAWNHDFFWTCMGPPTRKEPVGALADEIQRTYGSLSGFKTTFLEAAAVHFGSGWVWLVRDGGQLKIERTANAGTPIGTGAHPLLVCDLWEHAYYLDYHDRRAEFAGKFLSNLVDWDFVATRFTAALAVPMPRSMPHEALRGPSVTPENWRPRRNRGAADLGANDRVTSQLSDLNTKELMP